MSDKFSVVRTWISISLGLVLVISFIGLATLIDGMIDLQLPVYVLNIGGAAVGAVVWYVWIFRRTKQDD